MKLDRDSLFGKTLTFTAGAALFSAGVAVLRKKSEEHPAARKALGIYLVVTGTADVIDALLPAVVTPEMDEDDEEEMELDREAEALRSDEGGEA